MKFLFLSEQLIRIVQCLFLLKVVSSSSVFSFKSLGVLLLEVPADITICNNLVYMSSEKNIIY